MKSREDTAKEKISEIKDRSQTISRLNYKKKRRIEHTEKNVRDVWNVIKC